MKKLKIAGDLAICGYIRLNMPDGTQRCEKLPSSKGTKLGGRYIHPVMFGKKIIPLYFTRVRGGWRPDDLKK